MKLSDVINKIREEIEVYGDVEVLSYKFSHEHASAESWKLSPARVGRTGNKARMNQKEFKEFCKRKNS